MTPAKNGNGFRKWVIAFGAPILVVMVAWIFNEVVYGGIKDNAKEIVRIETEMEEIDSSVAAQLYDMRVMLMRIEVRQQADSQAIRRIERKIGD